MGCLPHAGKEDIAARPVACTEREGEQGGELTVSLSGEMATQLEHLKIITRILSVIVMHYVRRIPSHENDCPFNVFCQTIPLSCRPLSPKSPTGSCS